MRVIITLIIIILGLLMIQLWWAELIENISVTGTVVSAIAALATAWAAAEARKGALTAIKAVQDNRHTSRRERFEQHFSLLLAQHSQHHEKLTDFFDNKGTEFLYDTIDKCRDLNDAARKLFGHPKISPYMRVLYHLLKHINDDFYGHEADTPGRKKYSSLVRSLIRNDVLTLVAINGLMPNINSDGTDEEFIHYQRLLNRFEFFQHSDFFFWNAVSERVKIFSSLDIFLRKKITDELFAPVVACLKNPENESDWERSFTEVTKDNLPDAFIAAAFNYKSRRHNTVIDYINEMPKRLDSMFEAILEEHCLPVQQMIAEGEGLFYGPGRQCVASSTVTDIPDRDSFEHMLNDYARTETVFGQQPSRIYFFNEYIPGNDSTSAEVKFPEACRAYSEAFPFIEFCRREDRDAKKKALMDMALRKLSRRLESLVTRHADGRVPEKLDKGLLIPEK